MSAFFCSLTNHEVYYNTVYTQGEDSHWNEINKHLGQEEDGHTIVTTHILVTASGERMVQPLKLIVKQRYH